MQNVFEEQRNSIPATFSFKLSLTGFHLLRKQRIVFLGQVHFSLKSLTRPNSAQGLLLTYTCEFCPFSFTQICRKIRHTLYWTLFSPKSDCCLISPHLITPESNIKVLRVKEMITIGRSSWLFDKISLLISQEMCSELCGEYAYFC